MGTVFASDADLDTLSYAIASGNTNGAFAIDSATGEITVANPAMLNFESTPTFTLNVDVSDGSDSDSAVITINLSNVNEAPLIGPASGSIWENLALGAALGVPNTGDPDAGDTRTISIVSGNTDGAFGIHPTTGAVIVANPAAIDFETNPSFALGLRVTDAGGLTGDATWIVNLVNRNDIPTINSATFTLAENTPNGTVVGTIIANDQDAGDTKTFQLGTDNLGGVFAIDSSGVLTVANSSILNYETRTSITVHVFVIDSVGAWSGTTFTVNLTNVNDAPVVLPATTTRNEHMSNGSAIGIMSSSDQDVGDTRTWAITSGNVGGAFAINATTGMITVANSAAMNFEVTPTFVMTIQATDSGGLTGSATLTLNLANINEAPIVSAATFSLPENSANGTVVGTVPAIDQDAGAVLTYSIVSGNTNGAFALNSATGVITVANASLLNFESTRQFSFWVRASDGTLNSNSALMTINLSNVNEAPIVTPATFSLAENSAAGTVVGTVSASDPEDFGILWEILSGNTGGAFRLTSLTAPTIQVANPAALDFESTPTFTLVVKATDPLGLSGTANITINLTNVNDRPTLAPATFTLPENSSSGTVVGTLIGNDQDGNSMTYSIVSGNTGAFLLNSTTGVLTVLTPSQLNFETTPQFTFQVRVTDSGGLISNLAQVTVNLSNVNEPPIANSNSLTSQEDVAYSGTVWGSDPEGLPVVFELVTPPGAGTLSFGSNGAYTYTPNPNFAGYDGFEYRAFDGVLYSAVQNYQFHMQNHNDAPVAVADLLNATEDQTLTLQIGGVTRLEMTSQPGDYIGQGQAYSFDNTDGYFLGSLNYGVQHNSGIKISYDDYTSGYWDLSFDAPGFQVLTPGTFESAIRFPFNGSSAGLSVTGNGRGSNTLTGQFTVRQLVMHPGGQVRRFAADFEQHNEGLAPALFGTVEYNYDPSNTMMSLLDNDIDPDFTPVVAQLVSSPSHGVLTLAANGTLTYVPNPNFSGIDTFTYRVSDGTVQSAPATVTINVGNTNDAPTAIASSTSTDEDTPVTGTVSGSDIDNDPLAYELVSGPANGTLTFNPDGSYVYSPDPNSNGTDSFSFRANDGTVNSAPATVSININAVNDVPVANDSSAVTDEDVGQHGALTGSDVEGAVLTFALATGPANGSLTFYADGTYSYSPNADFNGTDSFTFTTNDGELDSAPATVWLSIVAVNDAPIANAQSVSGTEDTTLTGTLTGSDIEGSALTFSVVSGPANGSLTLNADGSFSYSPNPNFNGSDSFTFTTNDGSLDSAAATVSLSIAAVNDSPTISAATFSLPENSANGTAVGTVSASDVDVSDSKSFAVLSGKPGGAFAINSATGAITVANVAMLDFETTPTFTLSVRVTDGGGLTATANITINLTDVVETKFFTVDSGTDAAYRYAASGAAQTSSALNSGNTNSRGVAADITGTKYWVIDSNKTVYVYNAATGALLGSWLPGGLNTPQGITTDGTHVWIIDSGSDKVFKYDNAASRLSGSQAANSSFNLNNSNKNSTDLVTNGSFIWTLEGGNSNDKVFKYTVAGALQGSWTISSVNSTPTGLTIDPSNVSDIWIVDSGTDKVYQYAAAASRTSGSQAFVASFNLAAANTNAQGIADPPPAGSRTVSTTTANSRADSQSVLSGSTLQSEDRSESKRSARHRLAASILVVQPSVPSVPVRETTSPVSPADTSEVALPATGSTELADSIDIKALWIVFAHETGFLFR